MVLVIVTIVVVVTVPARATMPPPPIRLGGTWEAASPLCQPPMPAWMAVLGCGSDPLSRVAPLDTFGALPRVPSSSPEEQPWMISTKRWSTSRGVS